MDKYKYIPHDFSGVLKAANMSFCVNCGLVPLNNAYTRWAIRVGCNHNEHPDDPRMRKQLRPK